MPRLQTFEIKVTTGETGMSELPKYVINGFELPLEESEGGVAPGETLVATGRPDSFPHSLHLTGPAEGAWDIAKCEVTYFPFGEEPYTLEFAPLTLDDKSDLNIWHKRPAEVIDV